MRAILYIRSVYNQRHLALNCPAKLYDRIAGCLVVRERLLSHNHRIGSEIMEQYASSRRLTLKQQHSVNELLSLKPNNKQLKDHIHSKYKKWLNERLINAGQTMLKKKFPHIAGLQDVGKSDTCTFEEEDGKFCRF